MRSICSVATVFVGKSLLRTRFQHKSHTVQIISIGSRGYNAGAARAAAEYLTLEAPHLTELEVKKSKFFTSAWPISTVQQAMELIDAHRDDSASHNCYAYKLGNEYRSSDDGEPSGTAGRPILAAIEAEKLDGVCVLVVRFFGGIKLGAGGLVRAYGGAARECLQAAAKKLVTPQVKMSMEVPFELIGAVYNVVNQGGARVVEEQYTDGGCARVVCVVETAHMEALCGCISDATRGKVVAVPQDTSA